MFDKEYKRDTNTSQSRLSAGTDRQALTGGGGRRQHVLTSPSEPTEGSMSLHDMKHHSVFKGAILLDYLCLVQMIAESMRTCSDGTYPRGRQPLPLCMICDVE